MPTATPTAAGSGRSCTSAPPTTTLIDAPFQPSNASHSAARSDRSSAAPIGLAETALTRKGRGSAPATDSPRPRIRPIQPGAPATITGRTRPASTMAGSELIRPGSVSENHSTRTWTLGGRSVTSHASPRKRVAGRSVASETIAMPPSPGACTTSSSPARTPLPRVSCIASTPNRRGASLASHGPGTAKAR